MTPLVSVVCGVRDRLEHLQQSLPTWLACPEVSEVVVVDWSSREPLVTGDLPTDRRVVIARALGQEQWVASRCLNLGLAVAYGDVVLRLDVDDLLDRQFFAAHHLDGKSFYCFDGSGARDENERHLMGVVYAEWEHLEAVNGYNERIELYGYDDEDLVNRLRASGLVARPVDPDTVHHIPHGDELRTTNQVIKGDLDKRPPWAPWNWVPGRLVDNLSDRNRHLAWERPWGRGDARIRWDIEMTISGLCLCKEISR